MTHQHTKLPENEFVSNGALVHESKNSISEPTLNQLPKNDSADDQIETTVLISEDEEIFIETICIDGFNGENRISENNPSVLDITKSESVDQEKLLNSTFSGVDLGMVHTLLDPQSAKNNTLKILNNRNMGIHTKDIVDDSVIIFEENRNCVDIRSNMDTEEVPSQAMESDGLHDHDDNSKKYAVKSASENDGCIKNDTFLETSSHVFDCYIENEISGMHNLDEESGETVFSTPVEGKKFHRGTQNTDNEISGVYRKADKKFRGLEESVKMIIRDYPLISELEIGEYLKDTEGCSHLKLDKKGVMKILKHLKLESSYERFRYFVKA
jgi:hypothetical protein